MLDVFRAEIMKWLCRWRTDSQRRIPPRVIIYNVAYVSIIDVYFMYFYIKGDAHIPFVTTVSVGLCNARFEDGRAKRLRDRFIM